MSPKKLNFIFEASCPFNQKTRSIYVFTFRETPDPDRLDAFDLDKVTLEIKTSARKHQTFQFFANK
jgi:hypothetical protein